MYLDQVFFTLVNDVKIWFNETRICEIDYNFSMFNHNLSLKSDITIKIKIFVLSEGNKEVRSFTIVDF